MFPTWLSPLTSFPCGLWRCTVECMEPSKEIWRLTCDIACLSPLEGESFPDSWWTIALEFRSRMMGLVWLGLPHYIPREELWDTYISRLAKWPSSIPSSPPRKGILGLFQHRNANTWGELLPWSVYQCSQWRGKSLVPWCFTRRVNTAIWLMWVFSAEQNHARWLPWASQT